MPSGSLEVKTILVVGPKAQALFEGNPESTVLGAAGARSSEKSSFAPPVKNPAVRIIMSVCGILAS